jgi:ferredoxin-NADP reductase
MAGTAVLGRLDWHLAEVVDIIHETARTTSVVFAVPGWPGHRAGQHVDVRLTAEDGYQAQRSYSISSPPEDGDRVAITVERLDDGEVSPYLASELRAGDSIELRGPIGGYFTWTVADGGPLYLIGGGSGVAPLMAMLRHHAAQGSDIPATLLYSARTHDDVIFRDELERLAAGGNRRVVYTLTRGQPNGWTGYRRRIDLEMLTEVIGSPSDGAVAYVCGPTPLVEGVASTLVQVGFATDRVRTERFGPTGG